MDRQFLNELAVIEENHKIEEEIKTNAKNNYRNQLKNKLSIVADKWADNIIEDIKEQIKKQAIEKKYKVINGKKIIKGYYCIGDETKYYNEFLESLGDEEEFTDLYNLEHIAGRKYFVPYFCITSKIFSYFSKKQLVLILLTLGLYFWAWCSSEKGWLHYNCMIKADYLTRKLCEKLKEKLNKTGISYFGFGVENSKIQDFNLKKDVKLSFDSNTNWVYSSWKKCSEGSKFPLNIKIFF